MRNSNARAESEVVMLREICNVCARCEIRSLAICAALQENEVAALESIMTSRELAPEETLLHEGDKRRRVYSLTSGMLRLSTILFDGRRQITGFLMPGDYLGLADEEVYTTNVEAVAPSVLCSFSVQDMDNLMQRFPKLKERLYLFTRAALRQARDDQIMLGRLAPVEKLASFLLLLSARAKSHQQPDNPVPLPMSRSDIADYLGLTIETVSRSFTKLRTQGLIRLEDAHLVEILDRRALAAVAGIERH
ncbi:Crp/Fnr family transcriptional regulator [Aureimonas fodinaquatilis]|uniref:Crp/Fnr family transcriptional regulator n=1 Tax=Aureimonas fodinaquatilis TaxID=2565783 RepID=A0A5B0DT91_9HYPH|nr:Crp/Fnr family transcriptional regulator [Aureimonas fodinaquatilis]KAA0968981.1 Crp/Fnr family transcriptional regulator [Aureimonas fodinaquatilis]